MKMHVLVTGGAGFIGSHIVETLLAAGDQVTVFDNLSSGKKENMQGFMEHSRFKFILGDICDKTSVEKAMTDIDAICHQAALVSVPQSIVDPMSFHNCNINGFLNILSTAKQKGIKRIVYASTSAVYGDDTILPKIESSIGTPLSPYALTKYTNELYSKMFTDLYGLECIGLRYFNVFGPRQDPDGAYAAVVPKFISISKNNQAPQIYGDGSCTRDFIYVENVAHANMLALKTQNADCFGQVFNIGSGERMSILDMARVIKQTFSSNTDPIFRPPRVGDIAHSYADITRAQRLLGYDVLVSFSNGISKMTLNT